MIKELHITPLFVCQFDGSASAFFYVILLIKSNQITHHAETNSWYAQLSALRRNKIVTFLVWHKKTNEGKAEMIALIYTNLGFLGFWFLSYDIHMGFGRNDFLLVLEYEKVWNWISEQRKERRFGCYQMECSIAFGYIWSYLTYSNRNTCVLTL